MRDHHHGLVAALELTRASEETAETAAAAFLEFWHAEGRRLSAHIRQEENVLFPLVEEPLPPDELTALGEAIAAAEQG